MEDRQLRLQRHGLCRCSQRAGCELSCSRYHQFNQQELKYFQSVSRDISALIFCIESVHSRGSSLFQDAVVEFKVSGTGGPIYRLVVPQTRKEVGYGRMIAVRDYPLRIVFFHRHVSDGFQLF